MKTEKNIFFAFILNFFFAIFEFFGGIITGSSAILSDSIHDIGDAFSIGTSFFLEKKSKKLPNDKYTFGYGRLSVLGSFITTLILLLGALFAIYNAIIRILYPILINYDQMIFFAIIGVTINFCASILTHKGHSLNQKAVNLHMLEDVFGWIIVLIGALVMKFTNFYLIDPIMSILVAIFIAFNAVEHLVKTTCIFLEKVPFNVDLNEIKIQLKNIEGVLNVHHLHVWTMDGQNGYATIHVATNGNFYKIKNAVREELKEHGICHATIEVESADEICMCKECRPEFNLSFSSHHH